MNLQLVYWYYLSLSENENMFKKQMQNEKKKKKEKERSFPRRESNPRPMTYKVITIRNQPINLASQYELNSSWPVFSHWITALH